MDLRTALVATAALLLGAADARADGLRPIEAGRLDSGGLSGVAYYTVEPDGFHVVATLDGRGDRPLRVEVVLAPGARLVLSSAGPPGAGSDVVAITRRDDAVFLEPAIAVGE